MKDYRSRIREICGDGEFRNELLEVLLRLVETDTSPTPRIPEIRKNEERCFNFISEYIKKTPLRNSTTRQEPVTPEVRSHRAFTRPYYTVTGEAPGGLQLEQVYEGRHNLLWMLDNEPSAAGRGTALNAHIDVVSPFFPPKLEGGRLYGRGSCDDKANVAVILGALRVLGMLERENLLKLKNSITAMFVIEEETGGNGSLSIVMNEEMKKRYKSILVLEACDNNIHPANRGAVWFKCSLKNDTGRPGKPALPEAMCRVVLNMQEEGEKIKSESDHPLFPHRPVQTCNGMLGPFGEHPSRICGMVGFRIKKRDGSLPPGIKAAVEEGVREFTRKFSDKTLISDPETGNPKVSRHFDLEEKESEAIVTVYGSTGHMGAIMENDDAILKWAYIMRELIGMKEEHGLSFELEGADSPGELVLEGGQGFVPTHSIEEVQERMKSAAERGIEEYSAAAGPGGSGVSIAISYDKLHNDAFDGDPESPTMRNALRAGKEAGIIEEGYRVRGWDVSCDARLFSGLNIPVLTSGVGTLRAAHSNEENVRTEEIFPMIAFAALFLIAETGSVTA